MEENRVSIDTKNFEDENNLNAVFIWDDDFEDVGLRLAVSIARTESEFDEEKGIKNVLKTTEAEKRLKVLMEM